MVSLFLWVLRLLDLLLYYYFIFITNNLSDYILPFNKSNETIKEIFITFFTEISLSLEKSSFLIIGELFLSILSLTGSYLSTLLSIEQAMPTIDNNVER